MLRQDLVAGAQLSAGGLGWPPDDTRVDLLADRGVDPDLDPVGHLAIKCLHQRQHASGSPGQMMLIAAVRDSTFPPVTRTPGTCPTQACAEFETRCVHRDRPRVT